MPCSFYGPPRLVQRLLLMQSRYRFAQSQPRVASNVFWLPPTVILALILATVAVPPALGQDSGSADREFRGSGVELTVTVHDSSGDLLDIPAMVKLLRNGSLPSGQAETSRGHAVLVLNSLGDFTVVVKAAGFTDVQQDVSLHTNGREQIDIYLLRSSPETAAAPPGRPLLAPKAKEAFDKSLQALASDHLDDAEKFARKAAELAPAHPDVLYLQGLLFMKQRNWPRAQVALEKSTQIDPAHSPAFAALGMTLCDQGNYTAAIAPLEKSLQLEQSLPSQKPQAEKSGESSRQTPTQSQSSSAWKTRWTLAKAYFETARYEQALDMSQQALATSRGQAPEIALLVAQSFTAIGRFQDAAQTLRDFLRDHPTQPQASIAQRWLTHLTNSAKLASN
jgi:Tfp pilus assembly protein PilF